MPNEPETMLPVDQDEYPFLLLVQSRGPVSAGRISVLKKIKGNASADEVINILSTARAAQEMMIEEERMKEVHRVER